MSQPNKNCIQKTVIRHPELPRNCAQVQICSQEKLLRQQRQQQQLESKSPATKQKNICASKQLEINPNLLRVPHINSCAKNVQEIAAIKSFKGLSLQEAKELMPQTKATLALTKKLNFAPDEIVFKDLVSLNVNDSILLPKTKPNYRYKYKRTDDAANKVPVPDLADFLEPLPALDISLPEIPEWNFVYSSDDYDGFAAYKKYFGENHPYTD